MEFLHHIIGDDPIKALLIVLNLILIESLLSVDNAAVLATMVMDLPKEQRGKALKYGIIGAYVFRGISLVLASFLIKVWWLKAAGGVYLLYLAVNYFVTKATPETDDDTLNKKQSWFYKHTLGMLGPLWATVVMVEIMDMAFSIDNVFAAVAFTNNIWLICIGVFIGILAMRFVAGIFVKLMEKYHFLEQAAFLVIFILGIKLTITLWTHFAPFSAVAIFLDSQKADLYISIMTVSVFVLPIITSKLLGWPKKSK
ncbi:MAG: TerC family protein [Bacteroidetes bacterium]|jgi:YkoY family integral membrane protein|nr:TerC family protein [Bacteroidota bacterium]